MHEGVATTRAAELGKRRRDEVDSEPREDSVPINRTNSNLNLDKSAPNELSSIQDLSKDIHMIEPDSPAFFNRDASADHRLVKR